jgi:hypothetical protein
MDHMTILELLQQVFNATDEQTEAFTKGMKENKIYTTSEENMDIRHSKLKEQHAATTKQLDDANALLEDLRKGNKDNESLQKQVAEYKAEAEQLKAKLLKVELAAEAQVELLAAGAKPEDIDYLMFKMEADGPLEKGDDGKIKGLSDKISAVKTQRPASFNAEGKKQILENRLPDTSGNDSGITRESFAKMNYQERLKVYQDNPAAYAEMTKN